MATKEEYAQLSLYVYQTKDLTNRPLLPFGWEEAEPLHLDDSLTGFSYGVFRRTGSDEIVVAYTGSNQMLFVDYMGTNIPGGWAWARCKYRRRRWPTSARWRNTAPTSPSRFEMRWAA